MSDVATILVVDDDPIVRDVVVRYLERDGHRTLVAEDGDRADELLRKEELDLVVLDVMLPGRDGLELSRSIRARSTLPVILLTARGEEVDRIVGLELGADDYVTKPFSPRELAARVRALLWRASGQVEPRSSICFGDVVLDGDARQVRKARPPRKSISDRHFIERWSGGFMRGWKGHAILPCSQPGDPLKSLQSISPRVLP